MCARIHKRLPLCVCVCVCVCVSACVFVCVCVRCCEFRIHPLPYSVTDRSVVCCLDVEYQAQSE